METDDLLTITEAAALLHLSRQAVHTAIQEQRLPAVKVLGRWAVRKADAEAYLPRAYEEKRESRRPEGARGPGGRPRKAEAE